MSKFKKIVEKTAWEKARGIPHLKYHDFDGAKGFVESGKPDPSDINYEQELARYRGEQAYLDSIFWYVGYLVAPNEEKREEVLEDCYKEKRDQVKARYAWNNQQVDIFGWPYGTPKEKKQEDYDKHEYMFKAICEEIARAIDKRDQQNKWSIPNLSKNTVLN